MSNGSSLKIINYKTGYNSNDDNLAEDFFIPVLNRSNYFFRGVGYFSSLGFRKILRGIKG